MASTPTATWKALSSARPDLTDAGRELLYEFGVGLAFLATVRRDGGPRVHPMCPLIHEDGLYGFLIPSPKRADLIRDGRYSMHSFPLEQNEDAFYLTGIAHPVAEDDLRDTLAGPHRLACSGVGSAGRQVTSSLQARAQGVRSAARRTSRQGPSPG